jgi:ribosomal protein L20
VADRRVDGEARLSKLIADIAMHEAEAFSAIIAQAKSALEKKAA